MSQKNHLHIPPLLHYMMTEITLHQLSASALLPLLKLLTGQGEQHGHLHPEERRQTLAPTWCPKSCSFWVSLQVLPIGPDQWEEVAFCDAIKSTEHSVDSIHHKYHNIHRKSIPTVDPECREDARMKNCAKHYIVGKAELGGDEGSYNVKTNTFVRESKSEDIPPTVTTLSSPSRSHSDPR